MFEPAATGFLTGFSLILAIGPQNAFVLRQGLLRQHIFAVCLLYAVSDAILIIVGVIGFGAIVSLWPKLPMIMAIGGAIFLFFYGLNRFVAAWRGDYDLVLSGTSSRFAATLTTAAAITLLNPHVYLDTIGLIGAVSTNYPLTDAKTLFAAGAVTSSFVFFFGLGYGARLLAPVMQSARSWRVLDTVIGLVMWAIALQLLQGLGH